jgi:hypothetical protein
MFNSWEIKTVETVIKIGFGYINPRINPWADKENKMLRTVLTVYRYK